MWFLPVNNTRKTAIYRKIEMSVHFFCYLKKKYQFMFFIFHRMFILSCQRLILSFYFFFSVYTVCSFSIQDSAIFLFFCLFRCAKNQKQMLHFFLKDYLLLYMYVCVCVCTYFQDIPLYAF